MPAVEGCGNTDLIDLLYFVLTLRSSLIHKAGYPQLTRFGNDDDSQNDGCLLPAKEATTVAAGRQPIRRFA